MAFRKAGPYGSKLLPNLVTWDDGIRGNVKKIGIHHNAVGINFIKFEYVDGTSTQHGTISELTGPKIGRDEFVLEQDEYLTCMTVYSAFCVERLQFRTNKQDSEEYGIDKIRRESTYLTSLCTPLINVDKNITFHEKIAGFHGISSNNFLHQIGVYYTPV